METELALALSARDWSDRLHRFLADHGGARVRLTATSPEDLLVEEFDVLLIDDICSFLTPRVISKVKARGLGVIGVYDPDECDDGKRRLVECGIEDVIECGSHPDEFLAAIGECSLGVHAKRVDAGTARETFQAVVPRRSTAVAVGGPPGGTGVTEVAVSLAHCLAVAGEPVVLVDADDIAPSAAQRLGLGLHPNLRTALDVLEHGGGTIEKSFQSRRDLGFQVIAGLPNSSDWGEVRNRQVLDLMGQLSESFRVIVNIGNRIEPVGFGDSNDRYGISRSLIGFVDRLVAVGTASPVGMARLLEWLSLAQPFRPSEARRIDVVLNRAPVDQMLRGDLIGELVRTYRPASLALLPEDKAVTQSAWNGDVVESGKWAKELRKWVQVFYGVEA